MSAQANVAPVIIKRKKVVGGGGHHGGAWKVAYADFVTAMMAFFMLMWLLNATTETQRKGLADYFSPTVAINRVSGGGDGAFGGDSVFSEENLPQNGTGATASSPSEQNQARGETGTDSQSENANEDEVLKELEEQLVGRGGESSLMENELEHINTRITDEGLVIDVFALPGRPLFEEGTDKPTELLKNISIIIADVAKTVTNNIAIGGHVPSQPIVIADNHVWGNSADRATAMRLLLERTDISSQRIQRVTGFADREPMLENTMAVENNRLEVVMLRK